MRYIVFSDIHGNLEALEAMFDETEPLHADAYLFCGDIFGYFYQQEEIIDLLVERRVLCIKGNHDALYLASLENDALRETLVEKYGSSYQSSLPAEKQRWLEALPCQAVIKDGNSTILMVHGSPDDALDGRVYPDTALSFEQPFAPYHYILMGHTHYRMYQKCGETAFINPGSLGQPRDKKGCSYALLDTNNDSVTFYRVNIPTGALREALAQENKSTRNRDYLYKKLEEMEVCMNKKNIFVTSVGGDVACAVLRCLREEKDTYRLIGCDINEYAQGQIYVDTFLPAPRYSDLGAYKDFICNTCTGQHIDFFLPIGEQEIIIAAGMRDFFEKNGIVPVMVNDTVIETATDKYKTYALCKKIGVPAPQTVRLDELRHADGLPFPYPAILKKSSGCGSKGLRRISGAQQLQEILGSSDYAKESWIVQKEIGCAEEEYTMGVFSDGASVSSIVFRRTLGLGSMSVRVETVSDPMFQEIAVKIAAALGLRGSINVQMRNGQDGYSVFEINPRLSSSCGFRHLNGFTDAVWWIKLLDGKNPDISFEPTPGRVGIKILDDFMLDGVKKS